MHRIMLFGTTTVTVDGREVSGPALGGVKPRQVLELLALADGAPVTKDRLVEMVWGDGAPASAVPTLESYVCVVRRAIGGVAGGRDSVVLTTSAGYRLDTTRVVVDRTECLQRLARSASAPVAEAVRSVREALTTAQAPLLASETRAAWADRERDAMSAHLAEACADVAARALDAQDVDAAVELSRRAVELAPFDERAATVRIAALEAAGRRAEALRCYLDLRRRLVDELGVEPGAEARARYLRLLTGPAEQAWEAPSRTELAALLELLRDTLGRVPGLDTVPVERALGRVASHALALL
ncbi:AfsR/SARP family transcriptional regulator [Phycicoccus sonneratiae]|uniref:Winged helix-turn-helix domain-containing protein n=1 Tax=Phycicoccus sonneratiae TaxID=2807628 RepID=A0ABS2CGK6_9MICO|nr:BTAD domain-containing putative transcriptional regulator [Phycicoccus sonneraticus]MBM6398920.1 winged helix-turn-helix domain-containing protein [Phycicoccus sonneraticus]